jgi:type IV pilus assembly protein PilW
MKRLQGFTLIELMVAILLSAFLLLGLTQIFASNRQTVVTQEAFTRIQERGRIAAEMLAKDIRMADYWGCLTDETAIVDHLDHADTDYVAGDMDWLSGGVDGTESANSVTIGGTAVIDGTDILELKGSDDACKGLGKAMNSVTAASLHVSPGCVADNGGPLDEGDITIITNCTGGEMFSITNLQDGGGGDSGKKTVVHNTGSCNATANCVDNTTKVFSQEYGTDARILAPFKRSYFIANNPVGVPSLFVRQNTAAPVELVDNVEAMEILYGEDTDGDNAIEVYRPANTVADMENVLSIRVNLSIRSDNAVGTTQVDQRLRKNFVATSSIRNRNL